MPYTDMTKERIAEIRRWFPCPDTSRADEVVAECLIEIECLTAQLEECRKCRGDLIRRLGQYRAESDL